MIPDVFITFFAQDNTLGGLMSDKPRVIANIKQTLGIIEGVMFLK